jgi:hypothetical protein
VRVYIHPRGLQDAQRFPADGDRILQVFKHVVADDEVKLRVGERRRLVLLYDDPEVGGGMGEDNLVDVAGGDVRPGRIDVDGTCRRRFQETSHIIKGAMKKSAFRVPPTYVQGTTAG